MAMTLLGISGSLTKGGSTRTAIDCALRANVKRYGLAPNQSNGFHLIETVAHLAEQEYFVTHYDWLVLALVGTQNHRTGARRFCGSFLQRQQSARFQQVRDRMQRLGARHRFLGPQRCVREEI